MRTVRGPDGDRYLLVTEADEASLVRDPETGDEQYLPNEELSPVAGTAPLLTAADAVPGSIRAVLTACPDERALGLLIELVDRGPVAVTDLLEEYDRCESDLHGLLAEFQAAGLVVEAGVYGERGYEATGRARRAVATLRDADDGEGDAPDTQGRDADGPAPD